MKALRVRLWFWQLITRLSYFSQDFFYKIKNFFFLLWVNLNMITDTYLHDPPPFNGLFFMTPPFSAVSKSCDPSSVSTPPPPLLISDKPLTTPPNLTRLLHNTTSYAGYPNLAGKILNSPNLAARSWIFQILPARSWIFQILLAGFWIFQILSARFGFS